MKIGSRSRLAHVDDTALKMAVEHHRRAVDALGDFSFETAITTSEDLVRRMKSDLFKLEKELERRGIQV
jgi:hypothetical protein